MIASRSTDGYRPDIDGLRAVAVLSVILFHTNSRWMPGGFIGVDIFFVISGYLITGILAKELRQERFSFRKFYDRRVRRILPALWALLFVCVPISWWLMLPADAQAMGKSALWSIVAMGNVYFWRDVTTDYFAPQSSQLPFLHLWSLGVEEQFYLLWPLVLFLIWRRGRDRAPALAALFVAAVVVASTVVAEWALAANETRFAYYMLPGRAGELALGAAIALALPLHAERLRAQPALAHVAAVTGWGLLVIGLIVLNEHQPYPGWRSLLPAFATAALIASGHVLPGGAWLQPLRWRSAVWLGRCSYSAYLWHWPVLAWWHYLRGQPGPGASLGLLAVILTLARTSQLWIEDPARRAQGGWPRSLVMYGVLPATVVGVMGLVVVRGEQWGLPLYSDVERHRLAELDEYVRPAHRVDWICQQHVLDVRSLTDPRCEFGSGTGEARILLFGDSHAAEFAPVFRAAAQAQGVRVRSVALGHCAALPGSLSRVVPDWRVAACEDGVRHILERARDFQLLIIGGSWADYAHHSPNLWNRLEAHLRELTAQGHDVWLLPLVPALGGYDASCAAKRQRVGAWLECPTQFAQIDPGDTTNARLARLAASIPRVRFLSFHATLCNDAKCSVVDEKGRFLYADPEHLSVFGAQRLAEELLRTGQMPDLTRP